METRVCKHCGKELPIESFSRNGMGYTNVCKECNHNRRSEARKRYVASKNKPSAEEQVEQAKHMRLKDFSPRDLMAELKRRGYEFKMTYTITHVINSEDIEL